MSPASDVDKNGDLSVLEVFKFASEKTVRFFEDNNHLATEHPQLEDTGDRRSFRYAEFESNAEGNLASATYLKRRRDVLSNTVSEKFDSELLELMEQQEQIEFDISELKSAKQDMSEQEYFERLENLLIKLSLLTEELENKKN